ncbi:glutathionylspermidine synthase family protein [Verrucomicrobiota bacterium sgz303538]
MKRHTITPRADWQSRVEALGFSFHTGDDVYWDESAYYEFTAAEVDILEAATNELHSLCLELVDRIITNGRYDKLGIPAAYIPLIEESWAADEPALYGRFDLCHIPGAAPKLYEYNADTPTSLLEAAVVQWHWLQDTWPEADQFNSIHERLIARWAEMQIRGRVHFACVKDHAEDFVTTVYLEDVAQQAGLATGRLFVNEIGWTGERFVDLHNWPIDTLFKLYPWEWLIDEPFSKHLLERPWRLIEPAWKMILSNKAILPLLWEAFPGHPNLLPAFFTPEPLGDKYASKPRHGREGAAVTLRARGESIGSAHDGDAAVPIYQQLCLPPKFGNNFAVIGSWVIGNESAGIGIRESASPITGNTSRFVPHLFRS